MWNNIVNDIFSRLDTQSNRTHDREDAKVKHQIQMGNEVMSLSRAQIEHVVKQKYLDIYANNLHQMTSHTTALITNLTEYQSANYRNLLDFGKTMLEINSRNATTSIEVFNKIYNIETTNPNNTRVLRMLDSLERSLINLEVKDMSDIMSMIVNEAKRLGISDDKDVQRFMSSLVDQQGRFSDDLTKFKNDIRIT